MIKVIGVMNQIRSFLKRSVLQTGFLKRFIVAGIFYMSWLHRKFRRVGTVIQAVFTYIQDRHANSATKRITTKSIEMNGLCHHTGDLCWVRSTHLRRLWNVTVHLLPLNAEFYQTIKPDWNWI